MEDFFGWTFDRALVDCIDHSLFGIVLTGALLLWVYRSGECCMIYENSVCILWGCGEFWGYACDCCCKGDYSGDDIESDTSPIRKYKRMGKDKMAPILMNESTTGNTPNGHTLGGHNNYFTPTVSTFNAEHENASLQNTLNYNVDVEVNINRKKRTRSASLDIQC